MSAIANSNFSSMTHEERRKFLEKYLGQDFCLKGENMTVLETIIRRIEDGHHGFEFAELLPKLGEWLGKLGIVSFTSEALTISSIALFPVSGILSIINAYQSGQRIYGFRAVAYTTTAFAFNDPIPTGSPQIMRNEVNSVKPLGETLDEKRAWKQASAATLKNLSKYTIGKNGKNDKPMLQAFFRALGDNNRQKLCLRILKGFSNDVDSYITRMVYESNFKVLYPR